MTFFQAGDFVLASGRRSHFKIECDALTPADWEGIAAAIVEENLVPKFRTAFGVPRGGVPLSNAMMKYATPGGPSLPVLICEDVVTTGGSMERYVEQLKGHGLIAHTTTVVGVCFVARGRCPDWVRPLLQMPPAPPTGGRGTVSPREGGCWFCHKHTVDSPDTLFSTEFDTFLHRACLLGAAEGDQEAKIMRRELLPPEPVVTKPRAGRVAAEAVPPGLGITTTWYQESMCLNGPHVWRCDVCKQTTRSFREPAPDCWLIDPDNNARYGRHEHDRKHEEYVDGVQK